VWLELLLPAVLLLLLLLQGLKTTRDILTSLLLLAMLLQLITTIKTVFCKQPLELF
jgi:hypothetical protein